jgi:hypothetical protein
VPRSSCAWSPKSVPPNLLRSLGCTLLSCQGEFTSGRFGEFRGVRAVSFGRYLASLALGQNHRRGPPQRVVNLSHQIRVPHQAKNPLRGELSRRPMRCSESPAPARLLRRTRPLPPPARAPPRYRASAPHDRCRCSNRSPAPEKVTRRHSRSIPNLRLRRNRQRMLATLRSKSDRVFPTPVHNARRNIHALSCPFVCVPTYFSLSARDLPPSSQPPSSSATAMHASRSSSAASRLFIALATTMPPTHSAAVA